LSWVVLVEWNGEAKHSTEETARREEFVESSTNLLKRHEKITHPLHTGSCLTRRLGKGTDLQSRETLTGALGVGGLSVGTAEGEAAVSWQIPNNASQRRKRGTLEG